MEVKLNKQQLAAVKYQGSPLLIIAGAGTGKTTVVTKRIEFLIKQELCKPSEILALTFTEKAATEMEERTDTVLPLGYSQLWISTFHGFCDQVLRESGIHIGLSPDYNLMTEAETVDLIRRHLFDFDLDYFRPLGNPNKFIFGLLQHFSRLKDEDETPVQYAAWVKKQTSLKIDKQHPEEQMLENKKWLELSRAYQKYEEIKLKENRLDFSDLIAYTLVLFRKRPNVLRKYQQKFRYILVDEYQDTNFAQNELVKLLTKDGKNLTVVSDDDQSIYGWRGSSVANILQFRKHFPKTKVITLTTNYRSGQKILDDAYRLIAHNNPNRLEVIEKIDKKLVSKAKDRGLVNFESFKNGDLEADGVAEIIATLTDSKAQPKYNYSDIAILVRANDHAESFVRALDRLGIPNQFLGPQKLLQQPEIVVLVSYLKTLVDPQAQTALFQVLSMEEFAIPMRDLAYINALSRRKNRSLYYFCRHLEDLEIDEESKKKITKVIKMHQQHMEMSKQQLAGTVLYDFLEKTNVLKTLLMASTQKDVIKVQNIASFFSKLKSFENNHPEAKVQVVSDWFDLLTELGDSPKVTEGDWGSNNAVNLLTIHSAKGLEFPVVFLVNLVNQRFPSMNRSDQIPIPEDLVKATVVSEDYHIEEERRLFYVGMTRAKQKLYLTAADFYGDGVRQKRVSPFVSEALGEIIAGTQKTKKSSKTIQKTKETVLPSTFYTPPVNYLSVSQIETFRTCPLHYKLNYILNIPHPPSAALSFGNAIHNALQNFYTQVLSGQKPTEKLIHQCLKNSWINDGFSSRAHEKKFLEKGMTYLTGYLEKGFNARRNKVLVEHKFNLPLSKLYKDNYSTNLLKIGGKIDRVDITPEGFLEIVDYKTGANIPTQKEVDRDLQLSFYALAATHIQEPPLGISPDKIKLSLYYFETQEAIVTTRSKKDLEDVAEEIFKVRSEIQQSDFKCSGSYFCKNCEYKLLCST